MKRQALNPPYVRRAAGLTAREAIPGSTLTQPTATSYPGYEAGGASSAGMSSWWAARKRTSAAMSKVLMETRA